VKILQVSTSDVAGGAERSAKNLADAYRRLGHESWLAVGTKRTDDPNVVVIPNDDARNAVVRTIDHWRRVARIRGAGRALALARHLAEPARFLDTERGREDVDFPGTWHLLDLSPRRPDVVHLHNLHGGYFDLRFLPELSRRVPTILNVRDGWLMSGHCAFSLGCERWKGGCGNCPDLTLFPAVKRDATAFNWERKRDILAASRLHVTTPSRWMMDRVDESIVAAAAIDRRVIPNGVDTRTFFPGDRAAARAALGIEADALVLLVAANGLLFNVWKDYVTLRGAIERLGARAWPRPVLVLAVGDDAPRETVGSVELRFVPFVDDSAKLAGFYRAADVYLHAARVESFGNVLLEARACGTPVVATAVGGIVEQIRDGDSGLLVEPGNPAAFADAVARVIDDGALREALAAGGLQHVRDAFTLDLQAERFLRWYDEIVHG